MATYRIRFQATGGTVICTTNTNLNVNTVASDDADYLNGWVTIRNTAATHQPQVTLVQDLTGLVTVDDSFGLEIRWGNVNTYVLFMPTNTDVSSATWKYGSTQIKGSNLVGVADYGQIIVSANSVQAGGIGDNVTGVQVSTKAGLNNPPYNNPAYVNNGHITVVDGKPAFNYGISWQKPVNSTDLMYYLVLEHKGDPWGQSDGYAVGGVGIVSKDRQGYTNRSGWFDGSTGKHIKVTIHAMYKGGAVPSLVGLPQNVEDNRNQDTTEDYSAWLKFDTPSAGDPEYYTVKFYDADKTTLLQTKDGRVFDTSYQKGSLVGGNYPSPIEICPEGKGLTGWVQKIDNGAWGSTTYTNQQVAGHIVNNNLSYAAVYYDLTYTVTFKVINGKWSNGTTEYTRQYTYGTRIETQHIQNSTPNDGWSTTNRWEPGSPEGTEVTKNLEFTLVYDVPLYPVTYQIINGTWSDGSTQIVRYYASGEQISSQQVPTFGGPNPGWADIGEWSPGLPQGNTVTGPLTFIYTYTTFLGSIYLYDNNRWYIGTPYINIAEGNNWRKGIGYINDGTAWKKGGGS